ncbi:hypothetical protein HPP92_004092 [Vanilla planifolia]|uniref:Uncharacterized protein n=1 Tax=Vanilla planifolia TaxID=51239 RepID=A0A835RW43_VANPL|nr:hypothetical protein HPP92_004092 [Vanilla planifolia]
MAGIKTLLDTDEGWTAIPRFGFTGTYITGSVERVKTIAVKIVGTALPLAGLAGWTGARRSSGRLAARPDPRTLALQREILDTAAPINIQFSNNRSAG